MMETNLRVIFFNADITLWENEIFFSRAQKRIFELHTRIKDLEEGIFQIEKENVEYYRYEIKGSILSFLEISARNLLTNSK